MNRSKFIAVLVLCCALAALSIAFSPTEELRTYLRKMMPQVERAFAEKNMKFFEATTTPDFTYTDAKGKTAEKKEALEGLKQMLGAASNIKVKITVGTVSAKGSMGTAKIANHYKMDMPGGSNGKPNKMEMHMATTETFKKVGSKWLLHKIVEGKYSATMNGKPFDPMAGAPPPTAPKPDKKGGVR